MFKISTVGRYTSFQSQKSFTRLSMDVCGEADQINCSASFNSGIVIGFGCSLS